MVGLAPDAIPPPPPLPAVGEGVRLLCLWLRGGGGGSSGEAGSLGARRCGIGAAAAAATIDDGGGGGSSGRRGNSFGSRGSMNVVVLAVWSMKKVWEVY